MLLALARSGRVRGRFGDFVLQQTGEGFANIDDAYDDRMQLRANGNWTDARTPAQLERRDLVRVVATLWNGLTPEERRGWYIEAARRNFPKGNNAFNQDFWRAAVAAGLVGGRNDGD